MRTPPTRSRSTALAALVGSLVLFAGACASDSEATLPTTAPTSSSAGATSTPATAAPAATGGTPAVTAATSTPATAAATSTPAAVAATKVSANNATVAQLQAAFEAAGISNASRWAREVEEYRPYATTDTTYAKLRGELAKYNPAPGVVDAIVATLTLP